MSNYLKPYDKVLSAEAYTHNALKGDVTSEKHFEKIDDKLNIVNITGTNFPKDLFRFKLIVQCSSCMFIRRQLLSRLD